MKKYIKGIICVVSIVLLCIASGIVGAYIVIENYKPTYDVEIETSTQEVDALANISANVMDTVVAINTQSAGIFSDLTNSASGSGVIIDSSGLIVTNAHVIEDADNIKVILNSGDSYNAKVIGSIESLDLALISINAKNLKAAKLADSTKLVLGERIFTIGNPLGSLSGSISSGIISGLDRTITIDTYKMKLIQFDASVNPGNSGGALFNMNGELVGIVNAKTIETSSGVTTEGLGFAIPVNTLKDNLDNLKQNTQPEAKPLIGIHAYSLTTDKQAEAYGYDKAGVYIYDITENSSASKYGLKKDDEIIKVNNRDVTTSDDIIIEYDKTDIGEEIVFVVIRDNKELEIVVKLEK